MKNTLTLILFLILLTHLPLQSQNLLEFIGDRFFLGSLKHQVWRPQRSLTQLKASDTIYFSSRRDERAMAKAFKAEFNEKEEGDIRFTRFHKIKVRIVYTDNKIKRGKLVPTEKYEWKTLGRWSFHKQRLKLRFSSRTIVIEWLEFSGTDMKWAILEVIEKK